MHFIFKHEIPKGKIPTYLKIVAANRPAKANPRRVRWTVGGDCIVYLGDKSTKTADLVTFKILCNSVISTPDSRFMTTNIKNFYLNTPLACFEYMKIPAKYIPDDIVKAYDLQEKIHEGFVYIEIRKSMW